MRAAPTRQFMFSLAERLGCRMYEIEQWPMAELLEWGDWERLKAEGPVQSPEDMLKVARMITAGAH